MVALYGPPGLSLWWRGPELCAGPFVVKAGSAWWNLRLRVPTDSHPCSCRLTDELRGIPSALGYGNLPRLMLYTFRALRGFVLI